MRGSCNALLAKSSLRQLVYLQNMGRCKRWTSVPVDMKRPSVSSPSCPYTVAPSKSSECQTSHNAASSATATSSFVHRSLCDAALGFDCLNHFVELRFNHYSSDYHLSKCGMEGLEIEDQVQLAHVFKETIERLYEDLDEVEQCEW